MSDTELVTTIGNPGPGPLYLPTLGVVLGAGDDVTIDAAGGHVVTRVDPEAAAPDFDVVTVVDEPEPTVEELPAELVEPAAKAKAPKASTPAEPVAADVPPTTETPQES